MSARNLIPSVLTRTVREVRRRRRRRERSVENVSRANTLDSYEEIYGSDDLREEYLGAARMAFYDRVGAVVAALEPERLLDAGCGAGHLLATVVARSDGLERVVGVDYATAAIAQLAKVVPSAEGRVASVYDLPFADGTFDVVTCTEVLEHLDRPKDAIVELSRVCEPGGQLVLTVPDGEVDDFEGHVNFWSESEFRTFVSVVGPTTIRRTTEGDLIAIVRRGTERSEFSE